MRPVLVHLDPGLRLRFGVGVTAEVRAPLHDEDALVELGSHALGDRQAEKSGADDEEVETNVGVETSGHRLPRVSDLAAETRLGGSRGAGF
ncbi:hypothetical protein IWGMT90018_61570 [Mycobacterium kiyosense]|nr:hypothetical protein IWGMT90018_61570 [Mycobacterium kiyosense]